MISPLAKRVAARHINALEWKYVEKTGNPLADKLLDLAAKLYGLDPSEIKDPKKQKEFEQLHDKTVETLQKMIKLVGGKQL